MFTTYFAVSREFQNKQPLILFCDTQSKVCEIISVNIANFLIANVGPETSSSTGLIDDDNIYHLRNL